MECYRILNAAYPAFSGTGSLLKGGRWTSPGRSAVYCGESLSTCRVELLVHIVGSEQFPQHVWRKIYFPSSVDVERLGESDLPEGWDSTPDSVVARTIGDDWFDSQRSVALVVPSVPARGDYNFIINETHSDFRKLIISAPMPLHWDARLFPLADPR
jgi:RES domain-containing protein